MEVGRFIVIAPVEISFLDKKGVQIIKFLAIDSDLKKNIL